VRARLRSELLELIPQWLGTIASENSPLAGPELPTLSVEAVSILHDILFAKKPDVEFGSAEGVKRNRFKAFYDCLLRWGVSLPPLGPDAVKNFASQNLPAHVPSYSKALRDVRNAVRSEGEERERRLLAVQARRRTDDPLPLIRRALPAAPPASPGTGDAGRHRRGGERLELPSPMAPCGGFEMPSPSSGGGGGGGEGGGGEGGGGGGDGGGDADGGAAAGGNGDGAVPDILAYYAEEIAEGAEEFALWAARDLRSPLSDHNNRSVGAKNFERAVSERDRARAGMYDEFHKRQAADRREERARLERDRLLQEVERLGRQLEAESAAAAAEAEAKARAERAAHDAQVARRRAEAQRDTAKSQAQEASDGRREAALAAGEAQQLLRAQLASAQEHGRGQAAAREAAEAEARRAAASAVQSARRGKERAIEEGEARANARFADERQMFRAQIQSARQLAAAKGREAAEAAKAKAVADTARREAETAAGEASTAAAAATAAAGDLAARERSVGELRERLESQLRSVGQMRSRLEAQEAHAERPAAGTARTLSAQLDAQQMEIARLQRRVEELEEEGSGRGQRSCPGRTDAATHQVTFRDMRVNGFRADAFSLSMLRRAIEEGGCSFEALPVINALLLAMHTRGEPEPRMLFNSQLVRQAFLRLGVYDGNQTRASNRRRAKCWAWALGADEGNKGRGMDMIAIVTWDEEIDKPQIQVIAAAEVHDKSGHGLAALLERARENAGLHPEGLTHLSSDGASACASDQVGETVLFQRRQQEASSADPTALCHSAARTLCAIHGMAIEENAGIEAAFPMHLLWAFLALLHECFSDRGSSHADDMRKIWVETAKLPVALYNHCLGSLQKPVESKWGTMYECARKAAVLWQVHASHRGLGGTMIEEFLRACLKVMPGAVNPREPTRGGRHPLRTKVRASFPGPSRSVS